jgi:hypothetical protein
MAEQQQTRPIEVPRTLSRLIALNVEYAALLCVSPQCRKAVSLAGYSRAFAQDPQREARRPQAGAGVRSRDSMGVRLCHRPIATQSIDWTKYNSYGCPGS